MKAPTLGPFFGRTFVILLTCLIVLVFLAVRADSVYSNNRFALGVLRCVDGLNKGIPFLSLFWDTDNSDFSHVRQCLDAHISTRDANASPSYLVAWAYLALNQIEDATSHLRDIQSERDPLRSVFFGLALLQQGAEQEASIVWSDESVAKSALSLVQMLMRYGDLELSLRAMETLSLTRSDNATLLQLADTYRRMELWEPSSRTFERVLQVDPSNAEALLGMATIVIYHRNDLELGDDYLERLLNDSSLSDTVRVMVYRNLAEIAQRRGQYLEAVEWQRRLFDYPSLESADIVRIRMVELYFDGGYTEDGNLLLTQVSENPPTYQPARQLLAHTLRKYQRFQEAIVHYRFLLELAPNNVAARYGLARSLEQLGANSEALVHWQRYLELRPEDQEAITAIERLQRR